MTDRPAALVGIPAADLEWCHDAVQTVSRTFALSIDTLREPLSSFVCVGYLVCRIADTIEDTARLTPAEKTTLLDQYAHGLDPSKDPDATGFMGALEDRLPAEPSDDWLVVTHADRVLRTLHQFPSEITAAMLPPIQELNCGMKQFVKRHADHGGIRIQSQPELEEYCSYVAGTIGHLMTNLITRDLDDHAIRERLSADAEDFGLLLQQVNIAKDVHADYTDEHNVYLPATWLTEQNVEQEDVLSDEATSGVVAVIRRTVRHARSYLDAAQRYLETVAPLDRNVYKACAIPFLLAVGTLRELARRPEDALTPTGVRISRAEVTAVTTAVRSEPDPRSIADLRAAVQNGGLC